MKTDQSKHQICIASIKRKRFQPYDYKWTKFYETNSAFPYSEITLNLSENELIICSTVIDANNYSVLTTRKLVTNENGIKTTGNLHGAKDKGYGFFKPNEEAFTLGTISLENGNDLKYFIETGKASMIMIYGVRTLIGIQ